MTEHLFKLFTDNRPPTAPLYIMAKDEENAVKRAHFGMGIPADRIVKVERGRG